MNIVRTAWNKFLSVFNGMAQQLIELARVLRLMPSHYLMLVRAQVSHRKYDYTDVMVRLSMMKINPHIKIKRLVIECYDFAYKDALRHFLTYRGYHTKCKGMTVEAWL